jgi:predicted nuclease of predicted toxin-antitoxin system
VTTDKDFEGLIWKENRNHKGIIRLANVRREERLNLLQHVLNEYSSELREKAIIIAQKKEIRVRY